MGLALSADAPTLWMDVNRVDVLVSELNFQQVHTLVLASGMRII